MILVMFAVMLLASGVAGCACWQLHQTTSELHVAQAGWRQAVETLQITASEAHAATDRSHVGWREAIALSRQLEARPANDLLLDRTRQTCVALDRVMPLRYRMN